MGQVCSGTKEEPSKGGLLDVPSSGDAPEYPDPSPPSGGEGDPIPPSSDGPGDGPGGDLGSGSNPGNSGSNQQLADLANATEGQRAAAAARADLERTKRRELWIVNGAARGMVAVRSTRGSTGYYDQGFAGLLAQHLEQTTSFPERLPLVLPEAAPLAASVSEEEAGATGPPASPSKESGSNNNKNKGGTFYDQLARPPWEGMDLAVADTANTLRGREAAAAASGDPHKLMDALAESLLDGPYTVLPAKQQLFAGVRPMVENLL
mmetsp:Transcript_2796/g.6245  ORF Transcript_2796/g.6245 Transcript_2796/m.6245 type:complete len:264 (+) Transcript_2796:242-1033(+)